MEYVLTLFIMPMQILHKDEDYTIENVLPLFIMPMRKLNQDNIREIIQLKRYCDCV